MSYSLKKILSIVLKAKKKHTKYFLFYDKSENMCCYVDWCYRTKEKSVKLSELIPEYTPKISSEYYTKIKEDILKNGFDYKKGLITVEKLNIIDGHHRYFILKDIFDDEHEITVLEILDRHNLILHYLFILFIKLLKLIFRLIHLFLLFFRYLLL